jgi:hypothetical protein
MNDNTLHTVLIALLLSLMGVTVLSYRTQTMPDGQTAMAAKRPSAPTRVDPARQCS